MRMSREKIRQEVQHVRKKYPEKDEINIIYYMFGVIEMAAELADGKDETPFTVVIEEISKAYGYDLEAIK